MSKLSCVVLAGLLIGADALAADSPAVANATTNAAGADLEAQLVAARQKLEAAARDVAQLSSQLGQTAMARVRTLRTRAVLGLQLQADPSAKEQGATVTAVSPGGPAAEAGIAPGDVIVALNGESTIGPNASRAVVGGMAAVKPDAKVTVKVMRDGKPKELVVTARAGMVDLFPPFDAPGQTWRGGPEGNWQHIEMRSNPGGGVVELRDARNAGALFEGMELAELSPALGQYFGTAQGVLVVRVPHEGDFLKLQDGDVILSIDGRVPENASHATRILRSYQPGEKIRLKIMRQKKSLELEATLPEHQRPDRGPPPPAGGNFLWPGPPRLDHPDALPRGHLVPLAAMPSAAPVVVVPPR